MFASPVFSSASFSLEDIEEHRSFEKKFCPHIPTIYSICLLFIAKFVERRVCGITATASLRGSLDSAAFWLSPHSPSRGNHFEANTSVLALSAALASVACALLESLSPLGIQGPGSRGSLSAPCPPLTQFCTPLTFNADLFLCLGFVDPLSISSLGYLVGIWNLTYPETEC